MAVAHVVIVDDNPDFVLLMGRLVRHLGYEATCLTSGTSAMKHLAEQVPDLIILDLMMPDMDGLDVLQAVRKDSRLKEVPVVIFSALSDPKLHQKASTMGATDWWLKAGVDFASISQRIAQYLGSPDLMVNGSRSNRSVTKLASDDTSDPH